MAHHVGTFPQPSSGVDPSCKAAKAFRPGTARKFTKANAEMQRSHRLAKPHSQTAASASPAPPAARSSRPHYVASLTPKPFLPPPVMLEERPVLEAVQQQRQKLEERQARLWQQMKERREQHELRENLRQVHLRMKQDELRQQQRELEQEIEHRKLQQQQQQQQQEQVQQPTPSHLPQQRSQPEEQQIKEQPRRMSADERPMSRPSSRRGQTIRELWERERERQQQQLQPQHGQQHPQRNEQRLSGEQAMDFAKSSPVQFERGARPMTAKPSDEGRPWQGNVQRPSTPLSGGMHQGAMARILAPSRPRSAPGGRPAYARRTTVPRPRPLALRPASGRGTASHAVENVVTATLSESHEEQFRGVRIPAAWGWTLLPILLALPQELLAKVGRTAGVTAVVMMSETCRALAELAQGISLDLLQEVHGIDWRHTSLPRLRQLNVLERMDELLTSSMAVFKKPFVLSGQAQGLASVVAGSVTQLVSPFNALPDPAARVMSISCGRNHLIFLDSLGRAWTLGDARAGGAYFVDSSDDDGLILTEPTLVAGMESKTLIKAACGDGHTVAVSSKGEVFRWGRNITAGPRVSSESDDEEDVDPAWLAPDASAGLAGEVLDVAAGTSHIVCASLTGDTYAWGQNDHGQCARAPGGEPHDLLRAPALVGGRLGEAVARRIACGRQHTAVLTAEGTVYTFGSGAAGQLGRSLGGPGAGNSSLHSWTPLEVTFAEGGSPVYIVQVSCGDEHTICLSDVGHVYAFGTGDSAQLGLAGLRSHRSPVVVRTLPSVKEVVAGGNWSLFRAKHGKVYAAGRAGEEENGSVENQWLRQIVSYSSGRPSSSRGR